MTHPVLTSIAVIDAALDEVSGVSPVFMTVAEKQVALARLVRTRSRVEAMELRVLAAADDVAVTTGDRSTATWLAGQTRQAHGTTRRHAALAAALDSRWARTAEAFAAGAVNLAQALVMVEALDALPRELSDALRSKAESSLVDQAAELGPRELRNLGRGVLEHLAPEIASEHDYQRLLAEERRASAATKLSMRRRGDGSTEIRATLPDPVAGRLSAYLDAYTSPRRLDVDIPTGPLGDVDRLPLHRRRGDAFVALLEHLPSQHLPRHGGTATTVTVTLDHDTLVSGVGVATTSTGDRMTAGQVRRLACEAGIIPVVLGGESQILDVGRTRRLVTPAIRKALNVRDQGCTAVDCTMPASFCEAHHVVPWSRGGRTSLHDCKLLCSFHHHRAHDPAWQTHHQANGATSFSRRE